MATSAIILDMDDHFVAPEVHIYKICDDLITEAAKQATQICDMEEKYAARGVAHALELENVEIKMLGMCTDATTMSLSNIKSTIICTSQLGNTAEKLDKHMIYCREMEYELNNLIICQRTLIDKKMRILTTLIIMMAFCIIGGCVVLDNIIHTVSNSTMVDCYNA